LLTVSHAYSLFFLQKLEVWFNVQRLQVADELMPVYVNHR